MRKHKCPCCGWFVFNLLVKQLSEKKGITEQLNAHDQMARVQRMNNMRNRAEEIVNAGIICV